MLKKVGEPKGYSGFFARNKLWIAIFTLVGTMVGAGVLGIPYVVAKAGFLLGAIVILLIGLAFIFLNLFVGEFVLRTKKQHQLVGYAEKYLGKWGKRVMTLGMLFSIYGALIAYLIGEGEALNTIFGFGSPLIYSLIFFLITSIIIFKGMKTTGKAELILIILLLVIIGFIGVFSFKQINSSNFLGFKLSNILIPYGVIMFAYLGAACIPEMQEELGKDKKKMKKAIIIGSVIPIVLYFLFSFFVVGVIGLENFELLKPNERIATIALSFYSSHILGTFANIVAVLAMFTSYLTMGMALVEMYRFDYHFKKITALLLAFILPMAVVMLGLTDFIAVLGITGVVAGGLEGTMIILTYWRAKKLGDRKPEYSLKNHYIIGGMIILMFLIGIIYHLFF